MLGWALLFLVIAIVAGALGLSGVAGAATQIAWILFVVGLILAVVFFVTGRRPPCNGSRTAPTRSGGHPAECQCADPPPACRV